MSFVLSLLALLGLALLFLRERRLYIERHDKPEQRVAVAQEREAQVRLRVITSDVDAAPRRPPLVVVPLSPRDHDDRPAA